MNAATQQVARKTDSLVIETEKNRYRTTEKTVGTETFVVPNPWKKNEKQEAEN